jgi:ribosomal protein S27AE
MKKAKTRHQLIEDIVELCNNKPSGYTIDVLMWIFNCKKEDYFITDLIGFIDDETIKKYIRGLLTCRISEQELIDFINDTDIKDKVDLYHHNPRSLYIGQRVYDIQHQNYGTIIKINSKSCNKKEIEEYIDMITIIYDKSLDENTPDTDVVQAHNLYVVPTDVRKRITCPRCGNILLDEHNDDVSYDYYCPHCDENFD